MAVALTLSGCIPSVDPPAAARHRAAPPPVEIVRDDSPEQERWDRPSPESDTRVEQSPAPPPRRTPPRRVADEVTALPAPRPAWEARPVAADAREIPASTYVVRPGDTLGVVADRLGAGADAIARANGIDAPYTIRTGQRLTIPAGRYHLVRQAETGIAIARAYGVPWSKIIAANALVEPYGLRAGQRVIIPGAPNRTPTLAERAAAFRLDVEDILTGGEPALATNQQPARPVAGPKRVLPSTAAIVAPSRLTSGFLWPVDGRVVKRFGPGATGERNDGIKIAVPLETPVKATADGVVAYVGTGVAALGGLVIVRHGDRWASVYGYASKLLVQRGQSVKRGQTIALSGDTGFADRPELHFELRRGRNPVDPLANLPRL